MIIRKRSAPTDLRSRNQGLPISFYNLRSNFRESIAQSADFVSERADLIEWVGNVRGASAPISVPSERSVVDRWVDS